MTHAEAFKRMRYRCESNPAHNEPIWNSRDGVTPFTVDCRHCGGYAEHVDWRQDHYRPDYKPLPGERFFRDGTPGEALAIMWGRWLAMRADYPLEPAHVLRMLEDVWRVASEDGNAAAAKNVGSEFRKGGPILDVAR